MQNASHTGILQNISAHASGLEILQGQAQGPSSFRSGGRVPRGGGGRGGTRPEEGRMQAGAEEEEEEKAIARFMLCVAGVGGGGGSWGKGGNLLAKHDALPTHFPLSRFLRTWASLLLTLRFREGRKISPKRLYSLDCPNFKWV